MDQIYVDLMVISSSKQLELRWDSEVRTAQGRGLHRHVPSITPDHLHDTKLNILMPEHRLNSVFIYSVSSIVIN